MVTHHVLFLDIKSCLARIWCVGLTCGFFICQKLQFKSVTEDGQGQIRTQGFWLPYHHSTMCGGTQLPYPLRHNRKMSLTWNLMSHFSSRHTLCCYKLFKQLLKNSTFAAFAENSLWPWTWYVAIVRVISQVTGSIWCCHEPRLRSGFDSPPSRHLFDIWVPHSGRAVMWKGRRRWKVFDGHSIRKMLISLWGGCLRMPWVNSVPWEVMSYLPVQPDVRWAWLGQLCVHEETFMETDMRKNIRCLIDCHWPVVSFQWE